MQESEAEMKRLGVAEKHMEEMETSKAGDR